MSLAVHVRSIPSLILILIMHLRCEHTTKYLYIGAGDKIALSAHTGGKDQ